MFIAMPSRKAADGEYRDIDHPITSDTRERLQTLILQKYQETMAAEEYYREEAGWQLTQENKCAQVLREGKACAHSFIRAGIRQWCRKLL